MTPCDHPTTSQPKIWGWRPPASRIDPYVFGHILHCICFKMHYTESKYLVCNQGRICLIRTIKKVKNSNKKFKIFLVIINNLLSLLERELSLFITVNPLFYFLSLQNHQPYFLDSASSHSLDLSRRLQAKGHSASHHPLSSANNSYSPHSRKCALCLS